MARERPALYQPFLPEGQRAFVWKYAQAIGGRRPRHFHGEPELNLVVRGSATFAVGERVVRVSPGELIAFPSGQDHAVLDASPDLYLYAMGLERGYAEAVGPDCELLSPFHVRLTGSELERVVDGAAGLVDRPGAEQLGAELWQRVHWLGRRSEARASRGMHVLARRALELVSHEPDLPVGALARALRAHPSELSRHFHRDVGMTLVLYRTRLRLLRFIRLVDAGKHDLMTAAAEAGFGSYSQCHRAFHAELGCAPRGFFFSGLREPMQLAYEKTSPV